MPLHKKEWHKEGPITIKLKQKFSDMPIFRTIKIVPLFVTVLLTVFAMDFNDQNKRNGEAIGGLFDEWTEEDIALIENAFAQPPNASADAGLCREDENAFQQNDPTKFVPTSDSGNYLNDIGTDIEHPFDQLMRETMPGPSKKDHIEDQPFLTDLKAKKLMVGRVVDQQSDQMGAQAFTKCGKPEIMVIDGNEGGQPDDDDNEGGQPEIILIDDDDDDDEPTVESCIDENSDVLGKQNSKEDESNCHSKKDKLKSLVKFYKLRKNYLDESKGKSKSAKIDHFVASEVGQTLDTILKWKNELGITKRTDKQREELVERFMEIGRNNPAFKGDQIAKMLNIKWKTIERWANKFGKEIKKNAN